MEVQKEAFGGLMEYYKLLPTQNKRDEIISTLEELISHYSKICTKFGVMTNMSLNKEILNLEYLNETINKVEQMLKDERKSDYWNYWEI